MRDQRISAIFLTSRKEWQSIWLKLHYFERRQYKSFIITLSKEAVPSSRENLQVWEKRKNVEGQKNNKGMYSFVKDKFVENTFYCIEE